VKRGPKGGSWRRARLWAEIRLGLLAALVWTSVVRLDSDELELTPVGGSLSQPLARRASQTDGQTGRQAGAEAEAKAELRLRLN